MESASIQSRLYGQERKLLVSRAAYRVADAYRTRRKRAAHPLIHSLPQVAFAGVWSLSCCQKLSFVVGHLWLVPWLTSIIFCSHPHAIITLFPSFPVPWERQQVEPPEVHGIGKVGPQDKAGICRSLAIIKIIAITLRGCILFPALLNLTPLGADTQPVLHPPPLPRFHTDNPVWYPPERCFLAYSPLVDAEVFQPIADSSASRSCTIGMHPPYELPFVLLHILKALTTL